MNSPDPPRPLQCLITGGAGFIGAALARELAGRGGRIVCLDDLSTGDPERLAGVERVRLVVGDAARADEIARALAEDGPFDILFHLAARVGVRAVLRDPQACRRENLAGVRTLAGALADLPPAARPRVLAASSSEVYAESREPLGEQAPLRPAGGRGRFAYAASKRRGEQLLDEAAAPWPGESGPVHLRLFNVVGPGQSSAGGMVLPTFVEAARAGLPLGVHGDGRQVRTFAHVDEVARVLADLASLPVLPAGPLNVGGRARTSVAHLARTVVEACGGGGTVARVDPRASLGAGFEEVAHRVPDLSRLAALGIALPGMSLEEIVADTLARHRSRAGGGAAAGVGRRACASPAS
ncbi:MAG: NAD-dependent epimerase/dehydratase family protein [Planctomycetota bacterium]|jgi:UDP-glucose 4-epimerase|nr:NAD-dependent epimerase/dehydratase family protein [Planctomycetota bacterium]MDP6761433.1 NAD-dependent epimerase/dehydratase family protein [Planctomycetota bacterium]MDP6990911.1 NAD-dependent epimerase/dehydratase family protein [Planctomycetota bacterium]